MSHIIFILQLEGTVNWEETTPIKMDVKGEHLEKRSSYLSKTLQARISCLFNECTKVTLKVYINLLLLCL